MRLIINLIALTWIVAAISLVAIIVVATAAKAGVLEFSPKPEPRVTNALCEEFLKDEKFQRNKVARDIFRRCRVVRDAQHDPQEGAREPVGADRPAGRTPEDEHPDTGGGSTPPEDRGSSFSNPGNHREVGRSGEHPPKGNGEDFGNGQRGRSE